jgi:hypothetical protein
MPRSARRTAASQNAQASPAPKPRRQLPPRSTRGRPAIPFGEITNSVHNSSLKKGPDQPYWTNTKPQSKSKLAACEPQPSLKMTPNRFDPHCRLPKLNQSPSTAAHDSTSVAKVRASNFQFQIFAKLRNLTAAESQPSLALLALQPSDCLQVPPPNLALRSPLARRVLPGQGFPLASSWLAGAASECNDCPGLPQLQISAKRIGELLGS